MPQAAALRAMAARRRRRIWSSDEHRIIPSPAGFDDTSVHNDLAVGVFEAAQEE